jgi:triacylglycerol lipase
MKTLPHLFTGLALAIAALTASTTAQAALSVPGYSQTRYPIVLVHGMAGFDDILGIDYFYGVADDLRKNGATVLVASLSAFNDNDVRGEQLLKQLKAWSAAKGYKKFNLIAHSQGGPTARYVAGVAPDLVASISSVGSPHSMVANAGSEQLGELLTKYSSLVSSVGSFLGWLSGSASLPQDPVALQTWAANTAAFNARFPAGQPTTDCGQGPERASNGIYFYSATGNQPKTNAWDISDAVMTVLDGIPSDGLVPVCSAHWGKVLRDDYPWNHLDEINQVLGTLGKSAPDPVVFYRQQANRLKLKAL